MHLGGPEFAKSKPKAFLPSFLLTLPTRGDKLETLSSSLPQLTSLTSDQLFFRLHCIRSLSSSLPSRAHAKRFKPYSHQFSSAQPPQYIPLFVLQLFFQAPSWSVCLLPSCFGSRSPVLAQQLPAATQCPALLARYSSPAGIPPESFSSTPYFPVRNLHNPVLGSLGTTPAVRPSVCSHVLAPNDPSSLHTVSTTNIILN